MSAGAILQTFMIPAFLPAPGCAPGYTPVTLRNRHHDKSTFVFIVDETPLQKKLGVYEIRV